MKYFKPTDLNDLYIESGETMTINFQASGYLTGSNKDIWFYIPLASHIKVQYVNITDLTSVIIRGNNGYLINNNSLKVNGVNTEGYTVTNLCTDTGIRVHISCTTAFANSINNSPIFATGTIKFKV